MVDFILAFLLQSLLYSQRRYHLHEEPKVSLNNWNLGFHTSTCNVLSSEQLHVSVEYELQLVINP